MCQVMSANHFMVSRDNAREGREGREGGCIATCPVVLLVLLQCITTSLIIVTIYSHCFVTMSIAHVVISLLSDAASLFCFKIIVAFYCIDVVLLLCFCSTVTASFLHFPFRCILTALYRIAIVLSLYRIVIVS